MAVVAVWKCDRDGAMFDNKKDAEEHDKMLELAANITSLIERNINGISEEAGEEIGLLLAKRRDDLAKACKGKPEVLLQEEAPAAQEEDSTADDDRVTPLVANQ
ncbi:YebG family protein [Microbulbifer hainanensis]|uniref:YebG family protein n=1 Tax=Microbulbifer hainanensis TaxID=2735675 RepID=UPI001867B94F|nr:YebG family protein [Microbulbifer hainanensis]